MRKYSAAWWQAAAKKIYLNAGKRSSRRDVSRKPIRRREMAKSSLYVVTMPATLTVVVEAAGDKDAKETAAKTAELVFGKSLGVLSVVGDAKVQPVAAAGKADKKSKKSDDDDEEDEDEKEEADDEEEEEEDEDEEEEEEEEDDDEDEEEEDEDEEPAPKKSKKSDKADKKADKKADGKKKIKIKLKG